MGLIAVINAVDCGRVGRVCLVQFGVGACVVCGRVLDHTGWTTTTATISISIRTNITITMTLTITLFNNIAILMLGLAGVILGVAGYFQNSQTHTQSKFGHGSAGSCRAQRQARPRPSGAIGTRRGSERTINAPFLEGGLGGGALGRAPPNSAGRPTSHPQAPSYGLLGAVPFTLNPKTLGASRSAGNCPDLVGGSVGNIGPVGVCHP